MKETIYSCLILDFDTETDYLPTYVIDNVEFMILDYITRLKIFKFFVFNSGAFSHYCIQLLSRLKDNFPYLKICILSSTHNINNKYLSDFDVVDDIIKVDTSLLAIIQDIITLDCKTAITHSNRHDNYEEIFAVLKKNHIQTIVT